MKVPREVSGPDLVKGSFGGAETGSQTKFAFDQVPRNARLAAPVER